MKKMTYEKFIDNHHQGKVDIGVDNTTALILVKALPMRYYAAHLFWSWVSFLSIPTFIYIAIFHHWLTGILLLFIVTPLIWLSTRKSAAQFILNHAKDNKDFFNTLVKGDLLTFRFHDGEVAYDHGDYKTAFEKLQPLAEQGHTGAQHCLGAMYANGAGVIQDDIEAIKWIRKAAEQGHDEAQHNLGVMYANGQGIEKDNVEAVKWYRKAAEQGYDLAKKNLRIITKIKSILETGDGSEEHPYIVSDVSEEYLILQHFNKRPTLQAVLETEDGKLMDIITCEDETYYFKLK